MPERPVRSAAFYFHPVEDANGSIPYPRPIPINGKQLKNGTVCNLCYLSFDEKNNQNYTVRL